MMRIALFLATNAAILVLISVVFQVLGIEGILAQMLLPTVDRNGQVLAYELLVANQAARSCIREGNFQHLYTVIQTGGRLGMKTFDRSILELYQRGEITYDTAMSKVRYPEQFMKRKV